MNTALMNLTQPFLRSAGKGSSGAVVRPLAAESTTRDAVAVGPAGHLTVFPAMLRSQAVFVKNPDGSFACASAPGFMEAVAAAAEPLPVVPATARLRDTARALRQAVQQEIASE